MEAEVVETSGGRSCPFSVVCHLLELVAEVARLWKSCKCSRSRQALDNSNEGTEVRWHRLPGWRPPSHSRHADVVPFLLAMFFSSLASFGEI